MRKSALIGVVLTFGFAALANATTFYVRQTVGSDANDGRTAATAWQSISKLSVALQAGDTAYVGPGLYRDTVMVQQSGTADRRVTLIADPTGEQTGDPPGWVLISGAEPVDEARFEAAGQPGVYRTAFADFPVLGVTEMDGLQFRYQKTKSTKEHLRDGLTELETVARIPSSYYYDDDAKVLTIHTTDGKPPRTHEIELMKRGNGIYMTDKHYVTIVGFAVRHVADAGINFFRGAGDGLAVNNVAWGSRQGIRVYGATSIVAYGNTLFRNENCGIYFAAESTHGLALGTVAYDNIKGVRWSSQSNGGMALDNQLFDNLERGLAIESTDGIVVRRNLLVNNAVSQLMVMTGMYAADDNCYQTGAAGQLVADFIFTEHFKTLAEYQQAKRQDLKSREGKCAPLPAKLDVRAIHAATMAYAERAREILRKQVAAPPTAGPVGSPAP
jgi:hypothetical protein